MNNSNGVVLYLIGKKGLIALQALIDAGHCTSISAVVFAIDNGVVEDYSKEIKSLAELNAINIFNRIGEQCSKLTSRYAFAIGWRWLIDVSKHETIIVFHDSLLPKYRGFAPLVAQLINGELIIGVTAIIASERYDEGPIVSQESIEVTYPIKIADAIDMVSERYANQIKAILSKIDSDEPLGLTEQEHSRATYSVWRDDEDLRIDWSKSSEEVRRFVDSTGHPFKGAFSIIDEKRVVILDVEEEPDLNFEFRHVGKTIMFNNEEPIVICGKGLIRITAAKWFETGKIVKKWPKFRTRLT